MKINTLIKLFLGAMLMFNFAFAADSFVCSKDPVYINYKAGDRLNLDGAVHYAGEIICENNCRDYQNCIADADTPGSYYCPIKRYQDVGGDVTASNFSKKDSCDAICYMQNYCAQIHPNNCVPVDIQYSDSVTDYTGKELYTQREITFECNSTTTEQVGCSKWEVKSSTSTVDYNISGVGTIYKQQADGSDKAQNLAAMLEQQLHLFSGWAGNCEHGVMFNNPFSDPMAILGYAMQLYNLAGTGTLGDSAKKLHDTVKTSFDNAAKDLFGGQDTGGYMDAGSATIPKSASSTLADMNVIKTWDTGTAVFGKVSLLYTDVAKLALAAFVPTDQEMQTAKQFNNAWMGDSDADDNSLAYANCMASIGLSFPNLVSFSAGDINNTSPELSHIYENPIRLTKDQIAILMDATSEDYVKKSYYPIEYDETDQIVTYIAIGQQAYTQAGQVICGGKLAVATNMNDYQATEVANSGGRGSAIGTSVAKMVLNKMLGPYGIVASLIIDIVTSLKSGDACHDTSIASQWGLIQLKTNQFLNFDQCHHTGSECAAKWFWGSCMRTREKYCCYDQISTRIFAEGLKMEIYPAIDPKTGLANKHMWEKCDDITIDDLKNISFKECDPDEDPYEDHCFPISKYQEFSDSIKKSGVTGFDFESAASQAMNSLAIPGGQVCTVPSK